MSELINRLIPLHLHPDMFTYNDHVYRETPRRWRTASMGNRMRRVDGPKETGNPSHAIVGGSFNNRRKRKLERRRGGDKNHAHGPMQCAHSITGKNSDPRRVRRRAGGKTGVPYMVSRVSHCRELNLSFDQTGRSLPGVQPVRVLLERSCWPKTDLSSCKKSAPGSDGLRPL